MKRPDWYVGLLLWFGVLWRNLRSRFDFKAELHTKEKLEKLPCGHGIAKDYLDNSGEVVRKDYSVFISDNALPPSSSSVNPP